MHNPNQSNLDGDGQGDACDADDDNDGLPDSYEATQFCLNPVGADGSNDADGDWLTNIEEYSLNYTPCSDTEKGAISAAIDWQDVGIGLSAGEWFTVDASGSVQASPGAPPSSPNGDGGSHGYGGCPLHLSA